MKGRLRYINIDDSILQNYLLKLDESFFSFLIEKTEIKKYEKIILEVCCGKGEYINYLAQKYENFLFIGLDFSKAAIQRAVKRTIINKIENVFYLNEDFFDFLKFYENKINRESQIIANETNFIFFDSVIISFPDPWPKKRHHKRRLVNQSTIERLYPLIKEKGKLIIITDHPEYAKWIYQSCIKNRYLYKEGFNKYLFFKSFVTTNRKKFEKYFPFYETTFFKKTIFKKINYFCLIKK